MDCFSFPCLTSDVRIPPRLSPWTVLLGMCQLKSCKRIENANDDETCRDVSKPKVSVLVHGCMGLTTLFTLKMMMIKMINTRKINLMDANAFRTNIGGKDQDALCKLKGRIPWFR